MATVIRIHQYGNPDVLNIETADIPAPADHEILIRQTAIGLNFIDTYHRSGLYPLPNLPAILGMEAAGIVEARGKQVANIVPGERVAYATEPGAYCDWRCVSAERVVKIPAFISDAQAAAGLLKGTTAHYLIHRTYPVKPGDIVLFHAAAGGVGTIACQWLNQRGATVIGTVGSKEKAALAAAHGCHYVINYRTEDLVERVRGITSGKGVHAVYDSIGKDTFTASLDCLRPLGMLVSFGNASGPVPAFEPLLLMRKGSLFFTRPALLHYTSTQAELQQSATALFDLISTRKIKLFIGQQYALHAVRQAHIDLTARTTSGSSLLLPDT